MEEILSLQIIKLNGPTSCLYPPCNLVSTFLILGVKSWTSTSMLFPFPTASISGNSGFPQTSNLLDSSSQVPGLKLGVTPTMVLSVSFLTDSILWIAVIKDMFKPSLTYLVNYWLGLASYLSAKFTCQNTRKISSNNNQHLSVDLRPNWPKRNNGWYWKSSYLLVDMNLLDYIKGPLY